MMFGTNSTKKIVGDNNQIKISENKSSIVVIGNNCKISIGKHSGDLKVIGNTCEVKIKSGNGKVKFMGENNTKLKSEFNNQETSVLNRTNGFIKAKKTDFNLLNIDDVTKFCQSLKRNEPDRMLSRNKR